MKGVRRGPADRSMTVFVQFSGIQVNSAQENLACCRRVLEILVCVLNTRFRVVGVL